MSRKELLLLCFGLLGGMLINHMVFGPTDSTHTPSHLAAAQAAGAADTVAKPPAEAIAKPQAEAIAKALAALLTQPVDDATVRKPENWHRAVYRDWEHSIYTGPGQAMMSRWVGPTDYTRAPGKTAPAAKTAPTATKDAGK